MKTIIRILIALFFTGTISNVSARDEYTKVIKKEFTVNPDAQITIENSFGSVHCNNWDKDIVQIEVVITVEVV
jgi:hypothetical protein